MLSNLSKLKHASGLGAGMLASPALAAPMSVATWVQSQDWPTHLLVGSVALLLVGIVLKAIRNRGAARHSIAGSQPSPDPDHSIGAFRNSVLTQFRWGGRV
jgi:hypothetical protein